MKDQNKILKKGIEKPSLDFSKNIMSQIDAEEMSLSRVVQKHGGLKPSDHFTADIMGQLEGLSPKRPYQPAISKKAWLSVAAVFATIFVIMGMTPFSGSSVLPISFDQIDFNLVDKFESNRVFIYSICGVLILSIALLAEQKFALKKSD